jgi:wobble nucleotide-excising tRNase
VNLRGIYDRKDSHQECSDLRTISRGVRRRLAKINFIYGSNGTGKTTISRVIADATTYPDCVVTWRNGAQLEPLVYNRDFVEKNFNQPDELKGIFTLGEKDKETLDKIAAARVELDSIKDSTAKLKATLQGNGGKVEELEQLEAEFTEECWKLKQKYDAKFQGAFIGVRGSRQRFKEKLIEESTSNHVSPVPLGELEEKAKTVFGKTPQSEQTFIVPGWKGLIAHESNPILQKKVIGKSDVDIAAMIDKLGNSDWVKQGRNYYDPATRICPFCQKETDISLEKNLNDYFDEAFKTDANAIERLYTEYKSDSEHLQQDLETLLDNSSERLDIEKLQSQKALLDSKVSLNIQHIEEKRREPSRSVYLDSLDDILETIRTLLDKANTKIQSHNKMVANIQTERAELTEQVWRYLLDEEIKSALASYNSKKAEFEKAIDNLQKKIGNKTEEEWQKEQEIRILEKDTTSIQPTIDAINALLKSFGFQGFVLAKSEHDRFYKIQRSDGSDAKGTLSEGERNFIAFLYFYHLVKGSASESGLTSDRVVVFDDPVSSLDSNVLFVVSSLIKELFNEVRENNGRVKQVFVLTHNAYFHREVSFNQRRTVGRKLNEETFWTVRKSVLISEIQKHTANPVKNTYESLWIEVRGTEPRSPSLQNTLRRILEHYFKILGNVDPDAICAKFEGQEKWICRSLFSWVNAGSHSAHDDPHFSPDESMFEAYLGVFKKIFEKTGHIAHYKMMMGDDTN